MSCSAQKMQSGEARSDGLGPGRGCQDQAPPTSPLSAMPKSCKPGDILRPHFSGARIVTKRRAAYKDIRPNGNYVMPNRDAEYASSWWLPRACFGCRIDSQHLHELGDLAEMAQSVTGCFLVTLQDVHEENVFPRTAAHGARFDLAEADVTERKNAKRLKQNAREVLQRKSDGRFVSAAADLLRPADE